MRLNQISHFVGSCYSRECTLTNHCNGLEIAAVQILVSQITAEDKVDDLELLSQLVSAGMKCQGTR
jgi:hypothetical protein